MDEVQPGQSASGDLTFSPFLLDMARVIGRSGVPAGFFLRSDTGVPEPPGIDLRTVLLYQAGLLRAPTRLGITGRPANQLPTLRSAPISERPYQLDGGSSNTSGSSDNGPRVNTVGVPPEPLSTQVVSPRPEVGSPEKIQLPAGDAGGLRPGPQVSFDSGNFLNQVDESQAPRSGQVEIATALPHMSTALPRTGEMPFITRCVFRMWLTTPADAPRFRVNRSEGPYAGSFMVATPGSVRSITGRRFVLKNGKVLACNQGAPMTLATPVGDVELPQGSTVLVDMTDSALVRIVGLESSHGGVEVKVASSDAPQAVRIPVERGQQLLLSTKPLSGAVLAAHGLAGKDKLGDAVARGPCQVRSLIEKEPLMQVQTADQDKERVSALGQLKERLLGP